ncbi:MAG: hypothetical protein N2V78_08105 [Methanophagales archaeon]|nr:hypothetical protein [Methanophagales archaeon]
MSFRPTEKNKGVDGAEDPASNIGYSFDKLISLSRRDSLISHVAKNIVPLTQDDDIHNISTDSRYYTVVTDIWNTRRSGKSEYQCHSYPSRSGTADNNRIIIDNNREV